MGEVVVTDSALVAHVFMMYEERREEDRTDPKFSVEDIEAQCVAHHGYATHCTGLFITLTLRRPLGIRLDISLATVPHLDGSFVAVRSHGLTWSECSCCQDRVSSTGVAAPGRHQR
jgi:hypothetical protein